MLDALCEMLHPKRFRAFRMVSTSGGAIRDRRSGAACAGSDTIDLLLPAIGSIRHMPLNQIAALEALDAAA